MLAFDPRAPLQADVLGGSPDRHGPLPAGHDAFTPSNPNYHHTMQDTFDKVSAKSLQAVGDVAVTLVK